MLVNSLESTTSPDTQEATNHRGRRSSEEANGYSNVLPTTSMSGCGKGKGKGKGKGTGKGWNRGWGARAHADDFCPHPWPGMFRIHGFRNNHGPYAHSGMPKLEGPS